MASSTNFPANIVPQAPEDPLFGLMRAFRADDSKDKVDLVSVSKPVTATYPPSDQLRRPGFESLN